MSEPVTITFTSYEIAEALSKVFFERFIKNGWNDGDVMMIFATSDGVRVEPKEARR